MTIQFSKDAPRVFVIGEGMLELSGSTERGWRLGYGGDTINTAIHLARFGLNVGYVSALGDDSYSADLRGSWAAEGLDTHLVLTAPGKTPGLYAIKTDANGERSFNYWRGDSAARRMFDLPETEQLIDEAQRADVLVYSLITLAILPEQARDKLFALCRAVRDRKGLVAFDGNYRPLLWPDQASARAVRDQAIACCDIGLPTLADEAAMGDVNDAHAVATRWRSLGASEVAVKLGGDGCLIDSGEIVAPPAKVSVVDSSGAGDAFNAGYIAARLAEASAYQAALAGHRLAAWTIMRPGAIPARTDDAPYVNADSL